MSEMIPLFPVLVYRDIVNWDFSEIKNWKNPATDRPHDLAQISKNEFEAVRMLENFPDLKNKILDKFYEYVTQLLLHKIKWKMSTSWATHVEKGRGVDPHVHKNCEFSGLLYFDDEYIDQPPLEIDNPLSIFTSFFGCDTSIQGDQYQSGVHFYAEKGLLLFFPSYLHHQVGEVTRDKPRRSLAFNFVPTGYYGQGDSTINTKWLNL